jgi:hypothetical protein
MKKLLFAALALTVVACGSTTNTSDAGIELSDGTKVLGYLEGKTMVMEGADIPAYPNGLNENMNLGAITQCYHKTTIQTLDHNFIVVPLLGTLQNAPTAGSVGTCDRTTMSTAGTSFTSTAVLVDNVQNNADCFDITATYGGFSQEGRGKISADGKTVTMELYFGGKAANHRCANGAVGSGILAVTTQADGGVASTTPFTGDAQQVYRVQ